MSSINIDTVSGDVGNVTIQGAPGGDHHPVLDASNASQTVFEIIKNGVLYGHMVLSADGAIKGLGFFNGVYLALENTPTAIDPQLRWYNSPLYGQAVIQAYHSTSPTTKHALNLGASGKIFLQPLNGDNIEFFGPLIPHASNSLDAGSSPNRLRKVWATDSDLAGDLNCSSLHVASHTPASSTDTGTPGQICWDANYLYVCVATNTWTRVAMSSW